MTPTRSRQSFDAIIENKDRHTWLEMMNLLVGVSAPDDKTFGDRNLVGAVLSSAEQSWELPVRLQ